MNTKTLEVDQTFRVFVVYKRISALTAMAVLITGMNAAVHEWTRILE